MRTTIAFVLGAVLGGTVFAGAQTWDQQQQQQRQNYERVLQEQRVLQGVDPSTGRPYGHRNPC